MSWQLSQNKTSNRRRTSGRRRTLFIVVGAVLLIVLIWQTLSGHIQDRVSDSLAVPFAATSEFLHTDLGSYLQTNQQLRQTNQELRQEIRKLHTLIERAQFLERENERLSALLEGTNERAFVYADVIAGTDASLYNTALIDVGVSDGVEPGDVVYFDEVIPVGRIIDAREDTSLVRFFSHPAAVTTVLIGSESDPLRVRAHGTGAGTLVATIPAQVELSKGTPVYFLGPAGTESLGTVQEVQRSSDSFAKAYITLLTNPAYLLHVQIPQ